MTQADEKNLKREIAHIFESGANEIRIFEMVKLFTSNINSCIPYQKCPKCDGQGSVSKPPNIAGDVHEWVSSKTIYTCNVCKGKMIIQESLISSRTKR